MTAPFGGLSHGPLECRHYEQSVMLQAELDRTIASLNALAAVVGQAIVYGSLAPGETPVSLHSHALIDVVGRLLSERDAGLRRKAEVAELRKKLALAEKLLEFAVDGNFLECANSPPCTDEDEGFAIKDYCDACKLVHDASTLFRWAATERKRTP